VRLYHTRAHEVKPPIAAGAGGGRRVVFGRRFRLRRGAEPGNLLRVYVADFRKDISPMLIRALVATEDKALRARLTGLLQQADVLTEEPGRTGRSLRALTGRGVDLLVVDPGAVRGSLATALRRLPREREMPAILAVTSRADADANAALLASGCEAVLYHDLSDEALLGALEGIVRRRQAVTSRILTGPQPPRAKLSDFTSESAAMDALLDMAARVVDSDTSLLILGETGVGKEWLARAIHTEGERGGEPFVAVHCAALPEHLLESELFGHEEGAFTGAVRARRGAFEMAHGGTVFLDEIGEMPLHLQVKLLRVLQDHCIQRIGAEKPVSLDVRIMAASNRDLQEALKERAFRQDLFYRLSVVTLTVPPLRERREDIADIAADYVAYFSRRMNRPVHGIAPDALAAIRAYEWPGNVRELINVIERAVLLCEGVTIGARHLPLAVARARGPVLSDGAEHATVGGVTLHLGDDWLSRPLPRVRRQFCDALEREYLAALLRETGGHIGRTATRAGLNARSLYAKMRRYGLRKETFKAPAA
jgi:two-component system, NtrC family, response regulator AtoC